MLELRRSERLLLSETGDWAKKSRTGWEQGCQPVFY
jgi:hypothetical protein